jgi:hypothetical protein
MQEPSPRHSRGCLASEQRDVSDHTKVASVGNETSSLGQKTPSLSWGLRQTLFQRGFDYKLSAQHRSSALSLLNAFMQIPNISLIFYFEILLSVCILHERLIFQVCFIVLNSLFVNKYYVYLCLY